MSKLIIDRPDKQTFYQKVGHGSLTLLFWILWGYLWLPVITLILWYFGVDFFYDRLIQEDTTWLHTMDWYLAVIVTIMGVFLLWASINWLRFRGSDRRKPRQHVSLSEMAHKYKVPEKNLESWRHQKRVEVHFDKDAKIDFVK